MQEIWKDIAGYEGLYQISNLGNVKSLNYNHTGNPRLLSPKNHHTGYKLVMLCKNGHKENKTVHALVADAFIPNPEEKPCINHIDGNKGNNTVSNLEWATLSENTRHAIKSNLRADTYMRGMKGSLSPIKKPVLQCDKSGKIIKKWSCISEAARYFQCSPSTIINCCAGRIKSCKGYLWKYEDA